MIILNSTAKTQEWSRQARREGKSVGLVPTMGYLHEGHLSLIRASTSENDITVVSIFVNPTQFGPGEDLGNYPRDPESDCRMCRELGVDLVYMPEPGEVYGPHHETYVSVEKTAKPLCGASRPAHFRGVATVVLKLFNITTPSAAYFGAKDYQQAQVIKTMVRDLNVDVDIVPCPIVREKDGLAMSSRNAYLSADERIRALCLMEALKTARGLFESGETDARRYLEAMRERIAREPDAVEDYVSLVDPESLEDLERVQGRALAALAVRIGKTRLIDNMLFG